jgi:hypothetical protein
MAPKTLLTAALLVLGSVASGYAACSGHSEQAMTCADGTVYDTETGTCKVVTG